MFDCSVGDSNPGIDLYSWEVPEAPHPHHQLLLFHHFHTRWAPHFSAQVHPSSNPSFKSGWAGRGPLSSNASPFHSPCSCACSQGGRGPNQWDTQGTCELPMVGCDNRGALAIGANRCVVRRPVQDPRPLPSMQDFFLWGEGGVVGGANPIWVMEIARW